MATVHLIMGSNGAGKSTYGNQLEKDLNIQRIEPDAYLKHEMGEALFNKDLNAIFRNREDFIYEFMPKDTEIYREIIDRKYNIKVHFLALENKKIAFERVQERHRKGQHDVSKTVIERNFDESYSFINLNINFFKDCYIIDSNNNFDKIAHFQKGILKTKYKQPPLFFKHKFSPKILKELNSPK